MSIRAEAIEEVISFRNLGEIWSGPPALCGFWPRSSFFHSIHLHVKGWRGISFTGCHDRHLGVVFFGDGTNGLLIQDLNLVYSQQAKEL